MAMISRVARHLAGRIVGWPLLAALLPACGPGERVEITASRPSHSGEKTPAIDIPYADSFPSPESYRWALPAGWTERPATEFRRANFAFGPAGEGECYLSLAQGSELENINRWRKQMGQPALPEDQLPALPRKDIFSRPAAFVDLTGTYTGAGGAAPKENTRLLGLVREEGDVTLTVKMTGPAPLVAGEAAHFDAFIASLRLTPAYPQ